MKTPTQTQRTNRHRSDDKKKVPGKQASSADSLDCNHKLKHSAMLLPCLRERSPDKKKPRFDTFGESPTRRDVVGDGWPGGKTLTWKWVFFRETGAFFFFFFCRYIFTSVFLRLANIFISFHAGPADFAPYDDDDGGTSLEYRDPFLCIVYIICIKWAVSTLE